MNFFDSLLKNLQTNSDLLNFIGILFTVVASIYIFKKEASISFVRERYEKLIFPLFNLLEPVLYQKVQSVDLKNALQIIELNKSLADGKLLELYYYCSQNLTQQNFNQLCSYIDKLYDNSCRRLGLKTRSFSYRIARHQYKHWGYFLFYALISTFLWAIALIATLLILLCLITCLYLIYKNATDGAKATMLTFCSVFLFVLVKYREKHS